VVIEHGKTRTTWSSLIDPEDYFDEMNIAIHGIDEETVDGHPTFLDVYEELCAHLSNNIVVSHSDFDRQCFAKATDLHSLTRPKIRWLDSVKIAQRAWPEFKGDGGYTLKNLAKKLKINQFQHHDALDDARVAAQIALMAIEHRGIDIER
jgi:DNA polymerase-3 subunit epsilon